MKETEQTLLDQIKDEVAEQYGQISWKYAMQNNGSHGIGALWEYVCERYGEAKAKASCEATLKKASEKADTICINPDINPEVECYQHVVDKSSITDPNNITIV